jgi:hypothetical protein
MVSGRFALGFLYGMILGLFGVFLFSNFNYAGVSLQEIIYRIFNLDFATGVYEFIWFSFHFNVFQLFDPVALESINLIESFLPPFLGWFSAGLVAGTIVKGVKRSVLNSFIMVVTDVVLWLCFAVVCGANLTFVFVYNLYETGGGILTGMIASIIGGIIGGAISGKYQD